MRNSEIGLIQCDCHCPTHSILFSIDQGETPLYKYNDIIMNISLCNMYPWYKRIWYALFNKQIYCEFVLTSDSADKLQHILNEYYKFETFKGEKS